MESSAVGLLVARYIDELARDVAATPLPYHTALGALGRHVAESSPDRYQPSNVTWALIEDVIGREENREARTAGGARCSDDRGAQRREPTTARSCRIRRSSSSGVMLRVLRRQQPAARRLEDREQLHVLEQLRIAAGEVVGGSVDELSGVDYGDVDVARRVVVRHQDHRFDVRVAVADELLRERVADRREVDVGLDPFFRTKARATFSTSSGVCE